MPVTTRAVGEITAFRCTNREGLALEVIDLGATITSVRVPDRDGAPGEVTLGFADLAGYLGPHPYFGSTVGRFANRIANASFTLDGNVHRLGANNAPNHLHGGERGFARVTWSATPFETADESGVVFGYQSPSGEEGYPGALTVEAIYALTDDNELRISYTATANASTPVNLTNHAYWNLAGRESGATILEHSLSVPADRYLPVTAAQIPTGEIAEVAGTPMDFRETREIGRDIEEISGTRVGYDHCFVLRHRETLAPAARLFDPSSGRVMEVVTSQPGLQVYSGNNLDGSDAHGGFTRFAGLCLETQHFPDSPNRPEFPTTVLSKGERYTQMTIHRFSVEN